MAANPILAYVAANAAAAADKPDVFYGTSFILTEVAEAVRRASEKTRLVMAAHDANDLAGMKAAHDDLIKSVSQVSILTASLDRVLTHHLPKQSGDR